MPGDDTLVFEPVSRSRALGLLALAYLAYAAVLRWLPSTPVCPFRAITGRRCPLCGLTRGIDRTLAGDLRAASAAHPCAVPATVALAIGGPALVLSPGARAS